MKGKVLRRLRVALAVFIAAFHFIPIYILIMVSLKNGSDFSSRWLPPTYLYLDNYIEVLKGGDLLRAFGNTVLITLAASFLVLFLGAICAYPVARIKGKLSSLITNIVLAVMMIPSLSVIVPLYTNMLRLGGVNTYWGIILILTTYNLPMSVFLF